MSELPAEMRSAAPAWSRKASVAGSMCERLATATSPCAGRGRAAIGRAPAASRSIAPAPRTPHQSLPSAGARTTPSTGSRPSISAMLTVNSPFRLRNSLVPSSGSTSQNRSLVERGHVTRGDRLLGDHGDLRGELGQTLEDQRLGRLVGDRDRRGVGLGADRDLVAIVLQDQRTGALGERHDLGQQAREVHLQPSGANARST